MLRFKLGVLAAMLFGVLYSASSLEARPTVLDQCCSGDGECSGGVCCAATALGLPPCDGLYGYCMKAGACPAVSSPR